MFLGLGSSTTLLAPTVSSAPVMAALASGCRSPTMAGTLTCLGPLLTVSVTAEPSCTSVPAAGSVLTAWPAGMVALVFCSVAPTTRPAAAMVAVASASARPLTSGTRVSGGPELTV